MTQQNQQTALSPLKQIRNRLLSQGAISMFRDTLPSATGKQADKAAERFAKMCYTTISQNPALQRCNVSSIIRAASISASLNLDIDPRGLAYLVPYKNKGQMEAQFQIGYMGLIELAYRSGKVKAISAHCIYESEAKDVVITRRNGQFHVEHPFSYELPKGHIIAVYACAEIDGLGTQTTVLRKDEIQRFRSLSKAPDSPAWKNHFEAMAKKTAIRQLAKFLPKSILEDFSRAAAIDEQESFETAQDNAQAGIGQQQGSEVVDAAFEPEQPTEQLQGEDSSADEEPEWAKGQ